MHDQYSIFLYLISQKIILIWKWWSKKPTMLFKLCKKIIIIIIINNVIVRTFKWSITLFFSYNILGELISLYIYIYYLV